MSITRVQSKELEGLLSSGSTISFTSNVTAGNNLVLLAAQAGGAANRQISAVSDNLNGAWALAKRQGTAGTNPQSEEWNLPNTLGGACTITIVWANGSDTKDFLALEYSGVATTLPVDVTDGITQTTANTSQEYAASSDTTSANGSVILGVSALNGSNAGYASTSGFSQITSLSSDVTFAELIVSGADTTNGSYTLTNARSFVSVMVSYKAPAAAANPWGFSFDPPETRAPPTRIVAL